MYLLKRVYFCRCCGRLFFAGLSGLVVLCVVYLDWIVENCFLVPPGFWVVLYSYVDITVHD